MTKFDVHTNTIKLLIPKRDLASTTGFCCKHFHNEQYQRCAGSERERRQELAQTDGDETEVRAIQSLIFTEYC